MSSQNTTRLSTSSGVTPDEDVNRVIAGIVRMIPRPDEAHARRGRGVRHPCARAVAGRVPVVVGVSNPGLVPMKPLTTRVMDPGADGAMTGFAVPEMLVVVYDCYRPFLRHAQQHGFGLAIRKEILRRRGALRSAATRTPAPRLGPTSWIASSPASNAA